ncbi:hypothetical protein D7X96_03485 [Corallococcus interemptor]|uniref:Uncharacterized protein n=1 Tax=Corallococcus interemptor TaxID=2316720 RepID=A0A3A8R2W2_9BACT|nr:hypothetical protein [Corallococcus interemptor]RKH73125.1 hypothetical protein D7X96_03485 [Corallococcus interemptor]
MSEIPKRLLWLCLLGPLLACASAPVPKPEASEKSPPDFFGAKEPKSRLMMLAVMGHIRPRGSRQPTQAQTPFSYAEWTSMTPEQLFSHLLEHRECISYIEAYARVLGERPTPWRNLVHAPEIIRAALRTQPCDVNGLRIQLDGLIVGQDSRVPGKDHFRGAPYGPAEWKAAFARWPLCEH